MKIRKLELNHFRSARHIALQFDRTINVFVGANGVGKTTVLDALALLLSWAIARVRSAQSKGDEIREIDIHNDKGYAHLTLTCLVPGVNGESELPWRLVQTRMGRNPKESPADAPIENDLRVLDAWAEIVRDNITASRAEYNIPLFAYYPVNRAVRDIDLGIRQSRRFDLMEAYEEALSSGANFQTFFEWYRGREDLENEQRAEAGLFQPDPQLEAVRRAILAFLPQFSGVSVKRDPLRMEVTKNRQKLRVDQMSDGEKCLFAMVGDLARRLAIANPEPGDPLQGKGIVLIDEIDLHLHPAWQRMVIPTLTRTFPSCQFVVTTHAPEVITHVKPDSLFLLSQDQFGLIAVERAGESYGKTADRILEDLMGLKTTRPEEVADGLSLIFSLIDQNRTEAAKAEISRMRLDIGEDSDLVKADVLIKRKEIIGR